MLLPPSPPPMAEVEAGLGPMAPSIPSVPAKPAPSGTPPGFPKDGRPAGPAVESEGAIISSGV
jgi:hypothetical protein